jgi:hypothetical protein
MVLMIYHLVTESYMAISLTIPLFLIHALAVSGIGMYVYASILAWFVGLFPRGSGFFGWFQSNLEYPNKYVKIPVMILTAPGAIVGFAIMITMFVLWNAILSVRDTAQAN